MRVSPRTTPVDDATSRSRARERIEWIRDYAERRIDARLMDERRSIPPHVVLDLGRAGLFGVQVDEKYGGLALRHRDLAHVLEQLAAVDLGLGTWLLTSLFPGVRPIAAFGSPVVKDRLLPDLAAGRQLAGYAQTERGAGTHFSAMEARAQEQGDGSWLLSGDKQWIGNSSWAGVLTVMAHDVSAEGRKRGLTAFAVDLDRPGVRVGREILSLGMRGMVQGEISFRDVRVELDEVVGRPRGGLEVGVDSMSYSRFAIAATCLGTMRRCAQLMLRFAGRRRIATGRLLDHPVVRVRLAEVSARIDALDALLQTVAAELDAGESVAAELLATAKIAGSEFAWQTADELVQLLGSRGYDEATGVPQLLRDVRVTRIFEGASEPLLAFLGASAPNERSDLHEDLVGRLEAADVGSRLATAAAALRERPSPEPEDAGSARAWHAAVAGEAALWACLLACNRHRDEAGSPRTAAWLERRFDAACSAARDGDAREAMWASAGDLEEELERAAGPIGDVELQAPGERREREPLLAR
ncbi:MAG: acyl-CoA dehydrogenase family protein [Myxococcota bacterium]